MEKQKLNQNQKNILENVYDVLANNTEYVSLDEISSNFDLEIDYDAGTITLQGLSGEGTIILTAKFIPEG